MPEITADWHAQGERPAASTTTSFEAQRADPTLDTKVNAAGNMKSLGRHDILYRSGVCVLVAIVTYAKGIGFSGRVTRFEEPQKSLDFGRDLKQHFGISGSRAIARFFESGEHTAGERTAENTRCRVNWQNIASQQPGLRKSQFLRSCTVLQGGPPLHHARKNRGPGHTFLAFIDNPTLVGNWYKRA